MNVSVDKYVRFDARPASLALAVAILLSCPSIPSAEDRTPQITGRGGPGVYLDIRATTWRSRGRVSFPLEPTLRLKLEKAGMRVSDEKDIPQTVALHVDYREEQGAPLPAGLHGIVLLCRIMWDPGNGQTPLQLAIEESSTDSLGNAPYVEAVLLLETNPYFFFFGDIVRGALLAAQDVTGGLIAGLQRQVQDEQAKPLFPAEPFPNPADTLPPPDELHSRKAKERTIDELGRLKDPRAAGILTRLLSHPRPLIRVKAVTALGALGLPGTQDAITALADHDADPDVRAAAQTALGLGPAAPVP